MCASPRQPIVPTPLVFVPNINADSLPDNAEFLPGWRFRRATPEEADGIKRTFLYLFGMPTEAPSATVWQSKWTYYPAREGMGGPSVSFSPLPSAQWRYTVLECDHHRDEGVRFDQIFKDFDRLRHAFALHEPAPALALELTEDFFGRDLRHRIQLLRWDQPTDFPDGPTFDPCTREDLDAWARTLARLDLHDNATFDLRGIPEAIVDIEAIPQGSYLRFLGFFGLLESLLTHAPAPTDIYDSIGRQIRSKFTLLTNRFEVPVSCRPYCQAHIYDAPTKGERNRDHRVWSAMYAYRSALAHGGRADFKDGRLHILKGPQEALALVTTTTKAIARAVLREPRLLADLRNC